MLCRVTRLLCNGKHLVAARCKGGSFVSRLGEGGRERALVCGTRQLHCHAAHAILDPSLRPESVSLASSAGLVVSSHGSRLNSALLAAIMKHWGSQEATRNLATRKRPSHLLFATRITTSLLWIRALLLDLDTPDECFPTRTCFFDWRRRRPRFRGAACCPRLSWRRTYNWHSGVEVVFSPT